MGKPSLFQLRASRVSEINGERRRPVVAVQ